MAWTVSGQPIRRSTRQLSSARQLDSKSSIFARNSRCFRSTRSTFSRTTRYSARYFRRFTRNPRSFLSTRLDLRRFCSTPARSSTLDSRRFTLKESSHGPISSARLDVLLEIFRFSLDSLEVLSTRSKKSLEILEVLLDQLEVFSKSSKFSRYLSRPARQNCSILSIFSIFSTPSKPSPLSNSSKLTQPAPAWTLSPSLSAHFCRPQVNINGVPTRTHVRSGMRSTLGALHIRHAATLIIRIRPTRHTE
jgi:hypothetical protein